MRILWLATDRSKRVANIFGPLQKEISKISDVHFIFRQLPLGMLPKAWQNKFTKGNEKPPRLVNPKFANKFDFIMVDAPFAFLDENWDKITTKKGVLIEDQHGDVLEYTKKYMSKGFDVFFTRYNNILKQHPWLKDQTVKWLPHGFDPDVFKDYKNFKKWDCLMVGRIQPRIYPTRWKAHQQMSNSDVAYNRIERPEESLPDQMRWPIHKEYAQLINCSKISFACMSIFKYPVIKYFEIPACNSALFADYNGELGDLGFEPNESMVSLNDVDNIKDLVKGWLNSPKDLKEISQNGHELVHEQHTAKKRAEQLINYIEAEI
jgi:hypothetical protein